MFKRLPIAAAGLGILSLVGILFLASLAPVQATSGQGTAPTPTLSADAVLAQAQAASEAASKASTEASNAISSVNTMLSFIQVAGLFVGILTVITGTLLTAAGIRQIREYGSELAKAREELKNMSQQFKDQSEALEDRADNAIRALALLPLGEQQLVARNMKAALHTYLQAYSLDQENRATNYFLGHIYTEHGSIEQGITHLQRALADNYRYPPAEAALAYALRLQADRESDPTRRAQGYAEAEQLFLKALADDHAVHDINGESVWGALGGLYKKQNRLEDAIAAYRKAEKVTPQHTYPLINQGMIYFSRGDVENARKLFGRSAGISKQALDANPFDYWARLDLALSFLIAGEQENASAEMGSALEYIQSRGPLDKVLADLERLANTPHPPEGIDAIREQVEHAVQTLQEGS